MEAINVLCLEKMMLNSFLTFLQLITVVSRDAGAYFSLRRLETSDNLLLDVKAGSRVEPSATERGNRGQIASGPHNTQFFKVQRASKGKPVAIF